MTTYTITGEVIGPIWWPVGEDCTKEFRKTFTRTNSDISLESEIRCLRDALLNITSDGDFQSCEINEAWLTVNKQEPGHTSRSRTVQLIGNDENSDLYRS